MKLRARALVLAVVWTGALFGCAHRDDAPMESFVVDAAAAQYLKWRIVEVRYFVSNQRCGSGPFEIRLKTPPGKKGNNYFLYVYTPHGIRGHMTAAYSSGIYTQHNNLYGSDNQACVVRPEDLATGGAGSGGAEAAVPQNPAAVAENGAASATGIASAAPILLREIPRPPNPPEGRRTLLFAEQFQNAGWNYTDVNGDVVYRLWSDEPNDLQGAIFVWAHGIAELVGDEKQFSKEEEAITEGAAREAYRKSQAAPKPVAAVAPSPPGPTPKPGSSSAPPPAPRAESQPPRPSTNASWIGGYWHWAEGAWAWVGGRWRVPPEDVARDLTVHAPSAPPAPRAEPTPAPAVPTTRLVWTPGYWQWNGRAFVWVAGSWQVAPQAASTWIPDRWELRGGVSIFVPGGWRLRVNP